jgi:hypothetical protein
MPTATPADSDDDDDSTGTPAATATPASDSFGTYDENLREASSYTVTYDIEVSGSDGGTLTGTVKADLERGAVYQSMNIQSGGDGGTFEYYQPPGEGYVYTRIESDGRAYYQKDEASQTQLRVFAEPLTASGSGAEFEDAPEFHDEGMVQTSEGPRHRYVVDDVNQLPPEARASFEDIESVSFVILVDESRSLVTNVDYTITYVPEGRDEAVTVDFEIAYTAIGSTTVPEPEWLSEAEQQT